MPDLFDPADPSCRSGEVAQITPTQIDPQVDPQATQLVVASSLTAKASKDPAVVSAPQIAEDKEAVLRCQRVSKWYGAVLGVNQVSLELRGGITGLVGSNGAGKSTLMRLITGQLRPDLGQVWVSGVDAWSADARRLVGYCPEVDVFYEEMSGRQFVRTMARLCGYSRSEADERTEQVLARVGMTDRADRRLRGYSKGMRQRIKLAQALVHEPVLLVLDEPLSGIDPTGRREFIDLFRQLAESGKCLLISSHELDELEKLTEHVAIMARGRIVATGLVSEIRDRLDDHPRTVRIEVEPDGDKDRQRELAAALVDFPGVVGVELLTESGRSRTGQLLVRVLQPRIFYEQLAQLIAQDWYEITHLEALDESTQAVLGYLLGGSSRTA